MTGFQSMLFVPGNRPERFAKALASGADCVCIDLEDAVPAEEKDSARAAAIAALTNDARLAIRINGLRTAQGLADLLALGGAAHKPARVFIPMCESVAEIEIAAGVLADPSVAFIPLLETVNAIDAARSLAAHPAVESLMFGGGDLSAQLGVKLEWEPLLAARSAIIMAVAATGKWAIDVPWVKLDDSDGLRAEASRSKALGFAAKAAIHPAQIDTIHAVFRPTAEEFEEAEAAIAAFDAANGGAIRFRGAMLDAPFMARYRQIIAYKDMTHA